MARLQAETERAGRAEALVHTKARLLADERASSIFLAVQNTVYEDRLKRRVSCAATSFPQHALNQAQALLTPATSPMQISPLHEMGLGSWWHGVFIHQTLASFRVKKGCQAADGLERTNLSHLQSRSIQRFCAHGIIY